MLQISTALSSSAQKELNSLSADTQQAIALAIEETWKVPPLTKMTRPGDDDFGWAREVPSLVLRETGRLDFERIDKMMQTGQIAYPMALKKAPITAIVRSAGGFSVECADERMAKLSHRNLQAVLAKRIEEILTFFQYGAYYGEVTYRPGWPQDYGLPRSVAPYWVIDDFHGVHPTTVDEIKRDKKTNSFQGFVQIPPGRTMADKIEVDLKRALIIPNGGLFGNLAGESILQPVNSWWFWYELVWRAFLRFLQRQSTGVVVVKAPQNGRVQIGDKFVDNMSWALQTASSLHRTNYAALPSDSDENGKELWTIEVVRMGQNEGGQYLAAITELMANIRNFLLTGDPAAKDGAEFEVMLDTERTLAHIAMYLNEYVLPKFLMWNGSKTREATLSFQGANSRVLPLLFKLMAVAGNTAGNALRNVDWRTLMTKGGVPVLEEEEVEELRERQMEEQSLRYKSQWEKRYGGNEEEAKGQPDGEGRWASQRDKEGKPEKMEIMYKAMDMVKEAMDTPLLALTAPQVALLEELGLRADPGTIQLFNPHHDTRGMFTDKAHAVAPLPDKRLMVHGKLDDRATFRAQDAASLAFERVGQDPATVNIYQKKGDYTSAICGEDRACAIKAANTYGVYKDGELYIGPKGVKKLERERKFGEYVLGHEAFHGRKRSDGSYGADLSFRKVEGFRKSEDFARAKARLQVEEGATDLLTRNTYGLNHKYWSNEKLFGKPYYAQQMGALAIVVGKATGWDRAAAWKLINQMHYNINDDKYIYGILDQAMKTPKDGWNPYSYFVAMNKLQRAAKWQDYRALGWLFGGKEDERRLN